MSRLSVTMSLSLVYVLAFSNSASAAWNKQLYWTDNGSVYRANLDGTGTQTLHELSSTNQRVEFIAVDPQNRYLYQSGRTEDTHVGFVIRTDLDGNNPQTLLDGLSGVRYGFDIDPTNGKMYFGANGLRSANLDGSNFGLFYGFPFPINPPTLGPYYPHEILVDQANSRLFFSDSVSFNGIKSIQLDGSSPANVVSFGPAGNFNDSSAIHMAYDAVNQLLYTTRFRPGEVGVVDLNTLNYHSIINNLPGVSDIELDAESGKLYFSTSTSILSSNLDGSNINTVLDLKEGGDYLSDSIKIAVVPEVSSMFMVSLILLVAALAVNKHVRLVR